MTFSRRGNTHDHSSKTQTSPKKNYPSEVPPGSSSVIRTGDPNVIDESSKPDRHLTLVRPETLEATYPVTWFSMGIWKAGRRVVAPGVGFEPTRPKGPQANSRLIFQAWACFIADCPVPGSGI